MELASSSAAKVCSLFAELNMVMSLLGPAISGKQTIGNFCASNSSTR